MINVAWRILTASYRFYQHTRDDFHRARIRVLKTRKAPQ